MLELLAAESAFTEDAVRLAAEEAQANTMNNMNTILKDSTFELLGDPRMPGEYCAALWALVFTLGGARMPGRYCALVFTPGGAHMPDGYRAVL